VHPVDHQPDQVQARQVRGEQVGGRCLGHRHGPARDRGLALDQTKLAQAERAIVTAMVTEFGLDMYALALDMANFATFIDSTNDKASIAQCGHAKQRRVMSFAIPRRSARPDISGPRALRRERVSALQLGRHARVLSVRGLLDE